MKLAPVHLWEQTGNSLFDIYKVQFNNNNTLRIIINSEREIHILSFTLVTINQKYQNQRQFKLRKLTPMIHIEGGSNDMIQNNLQTIELVQN